MTDLAGASPFVDRFGVTPRDLQHDDVLELVLAQLDVVRLLRERVRVAPGPVRQLGHAQLRRRDCTTQHTCICTQNI